MKCINPIMSTSTKSFKPVKSATLNKNGYYTMYRDGTAYHESDLARFPCRKCYYCLMARSKEWTTRLVLESRHHIQNCILTLTYKDSPRSLNQKHIQDFLKRLRKSLDPLKIRYFYAGEYGTQTMRPHYHMIIFGWCPTDTEFWQEINGINYFNSKSVDKIWQHGYVTIDINPKEAGMAYTAGYLTNKAIQEYPLDMQAPFQRMSNRPGIGYGYYEENTEKIYEKGIYINGKKQSPPKYYDRKFKEAIDSEAWENIVNDRIEKITENFIPLTTIRNDGMYKIKNLLAQKADKRKKI